MRLADWAPSNISAAGTRPSDTSRIVPPLSARYSLKPSPDWAATTLISPGRTTS